MSDTEFVHLHVHSQYSMLDSALRLSDLVARTKKERMPAVALTDHGNMFGAVQFYKACIREEINPILGCEVNICSDRKDKTKHDSAHLVLLAHSQEGYRNLIRLVSAGWVEGMDRGKPRIDFDLLRENSKGIVGLSGCMGGYLAQSILLKGEKAGREALALLRDLFEPTLFYVEIQNHGLLEEPALNRILVSLARELELPIVATNDCHYLERKHAYAQIVLQCIAAGCTVEEMQRGYHDSQEMYFKSGAEMRALFAELPDAIENTAVIAELCGGNANPLAETRLPNFPLPEGSDEQGYFRGLASEGLEKRFEELEEISKAVDRQSYRERLQMECDVICQMGFPGYFLIVHDIINWAKQQGIPVGPGRGSGAGSLVAYAMRITELDPIPYGLLFERFLNPERVSMPDLDLDFCMERRDEVIEYVRKTYGRESVGHIATFHLLKSRSVVRDVARVMKMTPQEAGKIAALIPEPVQGRSVSIEKALEKEARLSGLYSESSQIRDLIDTAASLENLNRHAGMHAAGVVISKGPLWNHVPVFCPEPDLYVTQYHKDDVEAAGLIKFDFLGLKTLTVIDFAVKLINKRPDREANPLLIDRIALDDPATYALMQSGETTNIFQLESSGMQALMKQLKPDCFEDMIALVALYRPGPLGSGMVENFVKGKRGKAQISYPHPCLQETLKDTFGVMVYQEQVMQAARDMAGFSLGAADLLRRAMGRKKADEMAKQKVAFVSGALSQGHSKADADYVFDLITNFADYGFNKSHSAAYALIAYQCAYLKAHYPVEFLCSTMTADKDKIEKVVRTIAEARAMGITVLPPDVNESEIGFTLVYDSNGAGRSKARKGRPVALNGVLHDPLNPRIRFGLGAVKGVGSAALEAIFEARSNPSSPAGRKAGVKSEAEQPFTDLFDFTARVDLRRVNKAVIEALVQCGAMDGMHQSDGIERDRAFSAIDAAIESGRKISQDRESGQTDLFGLLGDARQNGLSRRPRNAFDRLVVCWDQRELLRREKSSLGFYLSGHPLDDYRDELKRFCDVNTKSIAAARENARVSMGGVLQDYRERTTKSGERMAFFEVEDPYGRIEVVVRPEVLKSKREALDMIVKNDQPALLECTLKFDEDRGQPAYSDDEADERPLAAKLLLNEIKPLNEALRSLTKSLHIRVNVNKIDKSKLLAVREVLEKHPGACPVTIDLVSPQRWTVSLGARGLEVDPSEAVLESLKRLFGEKVCELW
ncbi:MAG: DNA polymerase III subunit alpha [Deltaproteobacteria bacterium]|nr:DNA polymerase III subunit alpha [Deltaproteobacteria bacterium]